MKGRGLEEIGQLLLQCYLTRKWDKLSGKNYVACFTTVYNYVTRTFLGPDLIIIVLTMTEENTKKRIEKRHRGNQQAVDVLMVKLTNLRNMN